MNSGQDETYEIEAGQSYEVDLFRPEDAEGVARLFLTVYGREYPFKAFIDPGILAEENAAGRIISSVVRTEKGDIVGHNALFNSSPWHGIKESGAGLVHPLYRGGKGLFTNMVIHGQDVGAEKFGVQGIYGEAVCNHLFAQKTTHSVGWKLMGLEIALVPGETYAKEKNAPGRVTCAFYFKTLRPCHHTVHLPGTYASALEYIYENLDDTREFRISEQNLPDTATDIGLQVFDFAQVARMEIHAAGGDFGAAFDRQEEEALAKNVETIQAWVNLSHPWSGRVVDELRRRGYYLGGVLPRWLEQDGLLMQKTLIPPAWDQIQLAFDRTKKILEIVRNDWAATNPNATGA